MSQTPGNWDRRVPLLSLFQNLLHTLLFAFAIFLLRTELLQHLGVLPTLTLMDEEGGGFTSCTPICTSLEVAPFPRLTSVTLNPSASVRLMHVHHAAGSTPTTYGQS